MPYFADAVVCQAFYNPVLTGTLELLVSAGDGTEIEDFMVDTDVTTTHGSRASLAKPLIPPELENIQRCALMRVPLPDGFEGTPIPACRDNRTPLWDEG